MGRLHLFAARHTAQCHILRSTRSMGMKELRHQKGCVCLGGTQVGATDDLPAGDFVCNVAFPKAALKQSRHAKTSFARADRISYSPT